MTVRLLHSVLCCPGSRVVSEPDTLINLRPCSSRVASSI
jgi:hypothetical protein